MDIKLKVLLLLKLTKLITKLDMKKKFILLMLFIGRRTNCFLCLWAYYCCYVKFFINFDLQTLVRDPK